MLTGRDHRLFAPLAWTKTFSLVAALVVAVTLVPLFSRLLLSTGKMRRMTRVAGAITLAVLLGVSCWFLWGQRAAAHVPLRLPSLTVATAILGGLLGYWMLSERLRPIDRNPISRLILRLYEPTLRLFLAHKAAFLAGPDLIVVLGLGLGAWDCGLTRKSIQIPLLSCCRLRRFAGTARHGASNQVPGYVQFKASSSPDWESDDWIALDEGSWFYMPTLFPAASFSQAMEILQTQDALIKEIPEVENVLGKIGRVESALDPAPAAMVETYVMLKPPDQWRDGITVNDIWDQINAVATLPGVTPASPLQPIEGRVVMLQSGIKASMAIRIFGDSLEGLADASFKVAEQLKQVPQVNAETVNPGHRFGETLR